MRSLAVTGLAVALAALVASTPAEASRARRGKSATTSQIRPDGGPSAMGGVPGTRTNQMLRAQQQRARRGVERQRRMSPREKILAARDRQLGIDGGEIAFSSRQQAAAYTRVKARVVQLRTFGVAVATGIGGGFLAKMVTAIAAMQSGFHRVASDPNFGNPIAQVLDHNFAIGAVIGAGVTLVIGSVRAAQLRRRADAIERGDVDVDVDLARLD